MNKSGPTTVEWHIVFTQSDHKSRVMSWLNPDFQHCYAMQLSEHGNFWTIINPRLSYMQSHQVTVTQYPSPRKYAGEHAVILPVTAIIDYDKQRGTLCVFNCVEVVKALLGIRSFWTWTPWQLYKYLRRKDGRKDS